MRIQTGQVALVTGAASGIGLALCRAFAAHGVRIAMSDIEADALEAAVCSLQKEGADVLALPCDVSSWDQVQAMREALLAHFGRIDVVCNNAGVMLPFGPIWETPHSDWDWILDVNVRGVFNGIRAFAPLLVAQNHGHIVTTASMAGVSTIPGNAAYNATKHAVVALTETLAADLEEAGSEVAATVLCCGLVRTRIREAGRNKPYNDEAPAIDVPAAAQSVGGSSHLEPEAVAQQVIAAVERKQLYLFTNPGAKTRIQSRFNRLLEDISS